jgi:ComF family protein
VDRRARTSLAAFAEQVRASVVEPVLSVLFPPRCVGCGDFEYHLCAACRDSLSHIAADACPRCGEPGPLSLVHGRCSHCMDKTLTYARARAAFRHQGVARRLVADFKFGGQPVLGRIMADIATPAFSSYLATIAPADRLLVTWVPCHRSAKRERGYNQAEVLARALVRSSETGVAPDGPVAIVRKQQATKHQKGLSRAGRQQNLRGAFVLDRRPSAALSARSEAVVLVDDVYTTGATAGEVSSVISEGLGLPVYVFTFSRAVTSAVERHD